MSLPGPGSPRWAPTHVQVTVLQAQGLRPKAKGGGGSDAYALMALGKDKFATSVAERCLGRPVWREEATFELAARRGGGGAPGPVLQLTVLHRALVGLDKFLGRADVPLEPLLHDGGRRHTRWYKLHSKPGKKEKERGEIEVDIQFMRSNLTASMFDLSMKDKSRSTFGKLKDKLKGKRSSGLSDTVSAIVPSITHSIADSEDESAEKEKEKKKFKIKTLFSKPGLQKSSLSQSMSALPAVQPVTEKVKLRPGDFKSSWYDNDDDEEDEKTLTPVSEKNFDGKAEDTTLHPPAITAYKKTARKKELGKNTDVEKLTDVTVKEKDVKGPENQKNESEAKPVEVPTALPRESPSESSSTAYIPRNKQSLNPFGEEQKPEKPVASARTNQTKVVKPRPHPVKPMNTTPKSFSITSSVTEKRTEINPKKYDPSDPAYAYAQLTHDELIQLVLKQKNVITKRDLQLCRLILHRWGLLPLSAGCAVFAMKANGTVLPPPNVACYT
ncbi:rab11 family-interacting protein 1 isoform A [Alligator mississippiensis]|uniref:Rab11 family-interacting protein 1 isoform A n=1 Tax=Alligator mississippiensis TaxID=8496 RepID=A0A151NBU4_ALLMI|nr:rab11 family-interacting protein 1 isoform A [Alligator mississippiensis]